MIDLNRAINIGTRKLGQLKLTIAKFYRITGGTTQHLGVVPDINFPSQFTAKEFGESGQESALPWDQIPSTPFKRFSDLSKSITVLKSRHDERIKNDPEYQYLLQDVEEFNRNRERKEISLNETVRRKERDEAEAKRKQREEERAKSLGLKIEEKKEVTAPATKSSDYELKESGKILADLILSKVG
jgi:carboxyl-terminal processing protease